VAWVDIAREMSFGPSVEDQELLVDTFQRDRAQMTTRERLSGVVASVGFAVAVAGLWSMRPPQSFAIAPAALCVLVLALATRIRFFTPFGFTVPTQLAFVPLVFAIPLAIVPIAVVFAMTIARAVDVARGEVPTSRLLQMIGNSWFAVWPVVVFAFANVDPRNAGPELLLAALAAEFIGDFVVTALRDAIARTASLRTQLRESWVYVIDAALAGIGLVVAQDIRSAPAKVLFLVPLLGLFAVFARERQERLEGLLELNRAYRGTALALGDVVEADDGYTGEHCKSVVALALAVAAQLQLNAEQRRNLEFAALLHDVGKIAIPKEIINKPGRLDPAEWTIIKTHTLEGQRMLERVGGFMREVGLIVRSHHERWDGRGYPDGLAGVAIPLEARIIACCDSWNAMRTDRAYRKALSYEMALGELTSGAGTQFDPRVLKAFMQIVEPTEQAAARPGESSSLGRRHAQPIASPLAP
jgi:putative nucleotidyltransferase with HDIG domain